MNSHPITSTSFSYDGEFLAVASQGTYIDIVRVYSSSFAFRADLSAYEVFIGNMSANTPSTYSWSGTRGGMASVEVRLRLLRGPGSGRLVAIGILKPLRSRHVTQSPDRRLQIICNCALHHMGIDCDLRVNHEHGATHPHAYVWVVVHLLLVPNISAEELQGHVCNYSIGYMHFSVLDVYLYNSTSLESSQVQRLSVGYRHEAN